MNRGTFQARRALALLMVLALIGGGTGARAGDRFEPFDRDPGWEGINNHSTHFPARTIRQDFGFTPTRHASGHAAGEIGGLITPAAEPAYYAKVVPNRTFDDRLTASGVLACGEGGVHALLGFFNAATINEWRTPNTIALRIQGRGDVFYAYLEYATKHWRAGGDSPRPFARIRNPATGKDEIKGFTAQGAMHTWSLTYDPNGNNGGGVVTATIDGETATCNLDAGHKADGATFNRFGLLNVVKSADSPGSLWIDDLTINGAAEDLGSDPSWEGFQNRRTFITENIRPRFDFGFSPTRFAGGSKSGELGGLVFRGDIRSADRMAAYGDRVGPLAWDRPLRASGKIVLRRAVSDSTALFGYYHSKHSLAVNPSQSSGFPEGFVGFAVEGPSRDGFYVYPAYRSQGGRQGYGNGSDRPKIEPDDRAHNWTWEYAPTAADGQGRITLTLDGKTTHLDLRAGDRDGSAPFDRFGFVTTWIDGNGQMIYLDDLTYTATVD